MDAITAMQDLKDRLAALPGVMPAILKASFENLKPVVEDLNIMQLQAGERADGTILPNYSPASVAIFGKRPGPMTLHDEGNFYRGVTLEVHEDGVELVGKDIKTEMLQVRYGDDVIGLQEKSKDLLIEGYLIDQAAEHVKTYITHD